MAQKSFHRTDRVSAQLRRELGTLVHAAVREHGLPSVSVSDVEVTRDMAHAKVFVTALQPERAAEAVKALKALAPRDPLPAGARGEAAARAGAAFPLRRFGRSRRAHRQPAARPAVTCDGSRPTPTASTRASRTARAPCSAACDGILLLDKPQGLSSNQALQRVRHLFRAEKAGHTGSLDPLATGLLPVCFGEATKIAGGLLGARKAYETVARLGVITDTDDADGQRAARAAGAAARRSTPSTRRCAAAPGASAAAADLFGAQARRRAAVRQGAPRRGDRGRAARGRRPRLRAAIAADLLDARDAPPTAPARRMRLRHLRAQPGARPGRTAGLRRARGRAAAAVGRSVPRAADVDAGRRCRRWPNRRRARAGRLPAADRGRAWPPGRRSGSTRRRRSRLGRGRRLRRRVSAARPAAWRSLRRGTAARLGLGDGRRRRAAAPAAAVPLGRRATAAAEPHDALALSRDGPRGLQFRGSSGQLAASHPHHTASRAVRRRCRVERVPAGHAIYEATHVHRHPARSSTNTSAATTTPARRKSRSPC